MTVQELIDQLKEYDPEMEVIAFEGGMPAIVVDIYNRELHHGYPNTEVCVLETSGIYEN